jgi:hypothetical protein
MDKLPVNVIIQIDLSKDLPLYDWLKALMQNPIYEDETSEEEEFRQKLFNALNYIHAKPYNAEEEKKALVKFTKDYAPKPFDPDEDIPF